MRRQLALVVLLLAGSLGCRTPSSSPQGEPDDPDVVRIVERKPPPEAPKPRRFELVETAVLDSSTDPKREVEISIPIASTYPGTQTIESMLVRIEPNLPYDVSQDMDSNRAIHVHCKGPEAVSIELTYQVEITHDWEVEHIVRNKKPKPLSEAEKKLFARELAGS